MKLSSKNIYRDVKWSVLNTAQKNLPEGQNFSGQVPKKNENVNKVFLKKFFRWKVPMDT